MRLDNLEQLVLTAVLALRDQAYAVPIHAKVAELAERPVKIGSVYITLDRLEDKRYLSSWLDDPTPERGGRPKRYYKMLAAGERALRESLHTARRLQEAAEGSWRIWRWRPKTQSSNG